MLFARRASPCSPLPTLAGAASAVLASSPGDGCCFCFFVRITVATTVSVYSHVIDINTGSNVRNRVVKQVAFTPP